MHPLSLNSEHTLVAKLSERDLAVGVVLSSIVGLIVGPLGAPPVAARDAALSDPSGMIPQRAMP